MELRLTITVGEHGFSEENADAVLEAFEERHPEAGAVVATNSKTGTLSVTFSVEGNDLFEAAKLGGQACGECLLAAGLRRTQVLDVHVSVVEADEFAAERALQPA